MTLDTINNGESGYDARMKINAVIGAVNATLPIVTPGIAYVETSGNDSTGAVGDPTHPFATLQAAYNAGARVFDLGVGSFNGLMANELDIMLIGRGAGQTFVNTIQGTGGDVHGNGRENILINNIFVYAANGADGAHGIDSAGGPATTTGGNGSNGSNANTILTGLHCGGNVMLVAGNGGAGGQGGSGDNTQTPAMGGTGGNGADAGTLTIQDCTIDGYVINSAGNGGNGGYGGNSLDNAQAGAMGGTAGNGGAGGEIILIRSQVGGMYAAASNGGNGGGGGNGDAGQASSRSNGNAGSAGAVYTQFTQSATDVQNSESTTYRASLINGTWYS